MRRNTNFLLPIYLLLLNEMRRLQASGGGGTTRTTQTPLLSFGVFFRPFLQEYRLPPEVYFPLNEESNSGDHRNTTRPLIIFAALWWLSPTNPAS